MKQTSTALNALLFNPDGTTNEQISFVELYTITLLDGTVLRYADKDAPLGAIGFNYGGDLYLSNDVQFKRSTTKATLGFEVGTMDLEITPNTDSPVSGANEVEGVPVLAAIAQGVFDGANVLVQRGFMAPNAYGTITAPLVWMFEGQVTSVTSVGSASAEIEVSSLSYLLNQQIPSDLFQPGCRHAFGDAGCTIDRTALAVTGAVGSGATVITIPCSLGAGNFAQGVVAFTSGVNAGQSREIATYTAGLITIVFALDEAPAPGDAITVYPGCDKTMTTCQNIYSNLIHFGGEPFVPIPQVILGA